MTKTPTYEELEQRVKELGNKATEGKQTEQRKALNMRILDAINKSEVWKDCIEDILGEIKQFTGFEALAIRLIENEDFPYYVTKGFPAHFVEAEKYLCTRDSKGEIIRDSEGSPYVECMCGNVICGRTDASKDFFTEGGSFWSNNTSKLLSETTDENRQTKTRNRCNSEGYESVALFPLKAGYEILGLLQINDTRPHQFTDDTIQFFEDIGISVGTAFSRKQAEEALLESEKYYRAIFDHAGFGIALIDAETGKMIDFNTKAHESHGYTREEYMTLTPIDIDAIDSREIAIDRAKRIVKKGSEIFETKHRTRRNKILDILTSSVPIHLNGRNYLLNISHDITSRVQAELALQKSEEFSSSLLESSPNPIQVVNPDISIRYVNPAFEKLTGFDSKEILEKKAPFPWWIDDPRSVNIQERKARISKKERGVELLFRKKNGELFWAEISNTPIKRNGEIIYILTSWVDITKRKRAEEALRQAHDELEQRVKERTKELELQKSRLEKVNMALSVLLDKRDEDKLMMEEKVMFNVKNLIEPMIENLKNSRLDENQTAIVDTLEFFLKEIVSPFSQTLHTKYLRLTLSEIRVANLIKENKTTKEIAGLLNSTPRAIEFHRQNIRKKLGLHNRKDNLASHLLTLLK